MSPEPCNVINKFKPSLTRTLGSDYQLLTLHSVHFVTMVIRTEIPGWKNRISSSKGGILDLAIAVP